MRASGRARPPGRPPGGPYLKHSVVMQVRHQQIFQILLPTGLGRGLAKLAQDELLELTEIRASRGNLPAETGIVARVALGDELLELAVGEHAPRDFEREG